MVLEHVALYTSDLEKLKKFYVNFFSAEANNKYRNPRTGLQTYFLSFAGGARLELMMRPDIRDRDDAPMSTGLTHLAFRVGSREKVDVLTKTLTDAGYDLKTPPQVTGNGEYESCVFDPDRNEVEIVA